MVEKYDARALQGEKSEWKDYKAIVSEAGMMASFNQNDSSLIGQINNR